jgi:dTDP-4-dehydrorhamnose reductase
VLIAGGSGLLGSTVGPYLSRLKYEVDVQCRSAPGALAADLSDPAATNRLLDEFKPDVLINMVALTDVDACELNPSEAKRINVDVVTNIVAWIKRGNGSCHLLQISTDQVYGGEGPHSEEVTEPINEYSRSKLLAELVASEVSSTIVRTNFFGRSRRIGRSSLSDWIVNSLAAGKDITVFSDVLFDPLSLNTLAAMIGLMIEARRSGIFNLGSRNGLSKAEFAYALAATLNLPTTTMGIGVSDGGRLAAPRPKDMRMNCSRFETAYGLLLPSLREEIATMRQEYS